MDTLNTTCQRKGPREKTRAIIGEYPTEQTLSIAQKHNVSLGAVRKYATRYGARKAPDYKSDPKFFYRKPRPVCRTKREAMEAHQRRLEREKRNRLIAVYYPDYPNSLIAERLGMNVGTLRYLAHHLGLKKKPEVRSDINSNNAFRSWKTRRNNNLNNR